MLALKLLHRHTATVVTPDRSSTFDIRGMTSTFHQEHSDAALARTPVPPKLVDITHPWNGAPPKPIDKRRRYCSIKPGAQMSEEDEVETGEGSPAGEASLGVRVLGASAGDDDPADRHE
ncbi:hypothetical protein ABZY14_40270 [Streptomyces sp. NPDC006617]|uniref:hypothetical protein n=1 Tax=Streptomyces sp. NPDC006617 TaxID=3155354 RepID=UPI0033BAFA03